MCYAEAMNADTRAVIGTVVGTGLVVAGLLAGFMYALIAGVNTRIDDLRDDLRDMRAEMRDMRADMRRLDARLDALEVALAKVEQRLATLERVVLPPAGAGE